MVCGLHDAESLTGWLNVACTAVCSVLLTPQVTCRVVLVGVLVCNRQCVLLVHSLHDLKLATGPEAWQLEVHM